MGGIGPLKQNGGAFTGLAPLMNVAKAPGLWQHVLIRYRALNLAEAAKQAMPSLKKYISTVHWYRTSAEVQAPSAGAVADNEVGYRFGSLYRQQRTSSNQKYQGRQIGSACGSYHYSKPQNA